MARGLFRHNRAVSTVIGTILMILVVMVGMSILFGAVIYYSDAFQKGSGSSVLESITVEDVYFTTGEVRLTLYNTGKVNLIVTNVYIDGALYEIDRSHNPTSDDPHKLPLNVGEHGEVFIDGGFTYRSYHFKIVTSRGSGFEGTYVYEQP